MNWIGYHIDISYMDGEIAEILNISEGRKRKMTLSDVMNIDILTPGGSCAEKFQNEVYKLNQNVVYNEILPESKETNPLYPELFPSVIYGLRSTISEPTIENQNMILLQLYLSINIKGMYIEFKNPSFSKQEKNCY